MTYGRRAWAVSLAAVAIIGLVAAWGAPGHSQPTKSKLDAIVAAKKIRVGMADFAPFVIKDPKTNQLEGFEVDSARMLAKELGVQLELVEATWTTLIAGLQSDKYDIVMSGSKRTLQRALAVNFSDPYVSLKEFAMVRQRDHIKTWSDLDRKSSTICAVLGGAAYLELKDSVKQARILPLKDLALCGNAVVSGQATAWIEDQVNLSTFINSHPQAGLIMVDIVPFASYGEGNGYAIAKGDLDFLNWINIFITKMQNDGTYLKLARKYGLPSSILVKSWGQR